jgi:hypothetical protein
VSFPESCYIKDIENQLKEKGRCEPALNSNKNKK